jgi:hypothetical protein
MMEPYRARMQIATRLRYLEFGARSFYTYRPKLPLVVGGDGTRGLRYSHENKIVMAKWTVSCIWHPNCLVKGRLQTNMLVAAPVASPCASEFARPVF